MPCLNWTDCDNCVGANMGLAVGIVFAYAVIALATINYVSLFFFNTLHDPNSKI
jgi:hypothetical protein